MMMPFEWDVRVSSKDHTVAALYVVNDELATVGYTTLGGTTATGPQISSVCRGGIWCCIGASPATVRDRKPSPVKWPLRARKS